MPDVVNQNQETGVPDKAIDHSMMINRAANETTDILDSFKNDFPTRLVGGKSITDLMAEADQYGAQSDYLLANYPMIKFQDNKNYFDINKAIDNVTMGGGKIEGKTFAALNQPGYLGAGKDFDRYSSSDNFSTYGYTPGLGVQQEYKYGDAMTWGDTIGKALGGGGELAWNTFIEGWKGWGRMTSALFSWDSSKLMGSEEERYEIAKKQEDIFNRYAIYDTETSKDSLFNRQFFGSMLQQSGFAVGAIAQFAVEEFLTAGIGGWISSFAKAGSLTKGAVKTAEVGELVNDFNKASAVVTSSTRVSEKLANTFKNLIPFYGTASDIAKMSKAGAGLAQMTLTGLGGIKRALSEFNMARSESIFEAASTYKQLKDRLVDEYVSQYGKQPTGKDLEKINQASENASHDNFWTNVGVLSVMNRLQFDNMYKSFRKSRQIFNEAAANLKGEAFLVAGKVGEKEVQKAYQKSFFFGQLGAVRQIAEDFGTRKAAWEATKSLGRGLTRIEGTEGLQELIQNASDKGLSDYYYDLYHGKKGYTGKMGRILDSVQNPLTDMEGMKTFLMGALTGALISPGSKIITKINQNIEDKARLKADPEYKTKKQQAAESIALVNALYDGSVIPQFKKEWLANIKVQNKAAETMEEAAKNHNKYVFYNAKDSALAKTVAAAIKLDMFQTIRDSIRDMGVNMTDEEFKQAFGIDPSEKNRQDVKTFTKTVADQIEEYYTTFNNLKDKYGDRILPELYKNNTPEEYKDAKIKKMALDDAIEILTTNVFKAKQAVIRASELQNKIASNKNIGSSSMEVLTKMGSEVALNDHIKQLQAEIKGYESSDTLSKEQKEILKNKKEELELATTWKEAHAEIVNNSDEEYSPSAERRAYNSFADLVNLFNKRAKNDTSVLKEDIDDNFINIIDYIRLNRDNKDYIDAVNFLTQPKNMDLITSSMIRAHYVMNATFKKEHKEDIKRATDTEDEYTEDEIKNKLNELKEKKVAEPEIEETKETAEQVIKPDVLIDDIPAEIISIEDDPSNEDVKVVTYRYVTDKPVKTEEELAALEGVLYFNIKDKEYTDEDGKSVNVTRYVEKPEVVEKKEAPEVSDTQAKRDEILSKIDAATKLGTIDQLVGGANNDISGAKGKTYRQVYQEELDALEKTISVEAAPVSDKKADIERRRYQEFIEFLLDDETSTWRGKTTEELKVQVEEQILEEDPDYIRINAKYDAEYVDAVKKGEMTKEQAMQALEEVGRKDSKAYAELEALEGAKPEEFEEEEKDEDDVPDYAQPSERTVTALMQATNEFANKDFQVGYRQLFPSESLANKTDDVLVEQIGNKIRYTRNGINSNYVFTVATPEFMPGQKLEYQVITEEEDYEKMNENRLTKQRYNRSEIFDDAGKIKAHFDDVPIGVYSVVNGKRTLIGSVREPLWIQYEINGTYPHISTPEGISQEEHLKNELEKNRKLRKTILDAYNKNPKFVYTGQVKSKSTGILKILTKPGTLKERVNPKIGDGGINNRHGVFAIVRNGEFQTYRNVQASNVETQIKNIDEYKGVPVLLLPTPLGKLVPTFIGLPKVDAGQAEFIIEAWKAFTGKTDNQEIIDAVYNSLGMARSDVPQIGALRTYIDQYITRLESKSISRIGNGSDVPNGSARINIFDDGNMSIEVKDAVSKQWISKTIKKESDLPSNIIQLLGNLRTTIKFPDVKNENLVGINSQEKVDFLTMENGKLVSKNMTYNQYIMQRATTLVEKGVESKNTNNDWVYHSNPVIQMTINEPGDTIPDLSETSIEKPDLSTLGEKKEDKGAAFLAALKAQKLTDQQVEEKKEECKTGESLQTKINKF